MPSYSRGEARAWAREKLVGVANVVIPTVTSDFKRLNEKAIRHDVETAVGHGFIGALAVSEVVVSLEEYGQFCRMMVDQAAGRFITIHHAVFNTLEDNIEAVRLAEAAGAELVLLGYPPYFRPRSLEEVFDYTRAFCDATNLAVMLFPVPTWDFTRLDSSDIPLPMLRRLIDACPNIVAIKAEGGMPNHLMYAVEAYRALGEEVVISMPVDAEFVPMAQLIDVRFCGTNHSAYYGPALPRMHALIRSGDLEGATQLYHQTAPARRALGAVPQAGGGLLNRMLWKYQSWLMGYNGGPLRHPTGRVYARDMAVLRQALQASGLNPTADPDEAFFAGRNPA